MKKIDWFVKHIESDNFNYIISVLLIFVILILVFYNYRLISAIVGNKNNISSVESMIEEKKGLLSDLIAGKNKNDQEKTVIKNKINSLKSKIEVDSIISNEEMIEVLEVLFNSGTIELVSARRLSTKSVDNLYEGIDKKMLKHYFRLVFKGDFFSVLSYIKSIEQNQWNLFFDKFHYVVDVYPIAQVTLEFYTFDIDHDSINS